MIGRAMFLLILAIAVAAAPAAPIDITKIVSRGMSSCPAINTIANPCQRCPLSSGQTNSTSTCCSAQAPCFVGYANASDDFIAGMQSVNVTHLTTDRVSSRSQRPPVPPPRIAFS